MINFNNLKNIFDSNNSFLLTTHVNPDADAIGSEIALFQILNRKLVALHLLIGLSFARQMLQIVAPGRSFLPVQLIRRGAPLW